MSDDALLHRAERLERDAALLRQGAKLKPPTLTWADGTPIPDPREDPDWEDGEISVPRILELMMDGAGYPEPVDCGTLTLSRFGGIEYVVDLIIPGRIHIVAAEEGTGKTYGLYELAIRMAAAGGDFAGTWHVEVAGAVAYLSEMHVDDDWRYQQDILDALGLDRSALTGQLYRLDLGTAAHGAPVLTDPDWRAWFTSWSRRRGIRLAVFDTGTGASQVDPWGKAIQQVYRDLRVMLAEHPELAVVLLLHLKKPQGKGQRRISDVLGEWGRWCDVLVLMEAEGVDRTKVSTHKRLHRHRRIVATRSGGLLVDPVDVTDVKAEKKVKPRDQIATIEAYPGLTYAELADVWKVTKPTVIKWCRDLGDSVVIVAGQRGQMRVYPRKAFDSDRPPSSDRQTSVIDGAIDGDLTVTVKPSNAPYREGAFDVRRSSTSPAESSVEDDYPMSATDPDA